MSFDLYVFDRAVLPEAAEAIGDLLEDDEVWGDPLTAPLAALVSGLAARYPNPDEDSDDDPIWASWPLGESVAGGTCCTVNIRWPHADAIGAAVTEAALRLGLTVYDPQTDEMHRGPSAPS